MMEDSTQPLPKKVTKNIVRRLKLRIITLCIISCFLLTIQTIPVSAKKTRVYWDIYFKNIKKKTVVLRCEVAKTVNEKATGLMFRKKLDRNHGMIFVYEHPQILRFWMKHTKIPLSIAFVDERYNITEIYHMRSYDERIVSSNMKVLYAIEVPRGWFKKNYIFPRSKIRIIKK